MYKKILISFVSIFFMVACNVGNTANNNLSDGTIITKKNLGVFPANALSYKGNYEFTIDDIQYVSDGLNVNGFIAYPVKTNSTKKLPSVLYLRGGNNIPNNQLNVLTAANIHRFIGFLAANGYTVIAPNYRGSPTSQGKDEYGGEELHDSVSLIKVVEGYYSTTDTNNLGVVGISRGGMEAYLLNKQNLIKSKVYLINSGVADLLNMTQERQDMYEMLVTDNLFLSQTDLVERSAVYWPELLDPKAKYYLYIAEKDERVDPKTEYELVNKLAKLNYNVNFSSYPDATHTIPENLHEWHADMIKQLNSALQN